MAGVPRPVIRRLRGNLIAGSATGIMHGINRAISTELNSRVRALGAALEKDKIPDAYLESTNLRIAQAAQNAVVAGWRSRLPRRSGDYRPEDRLTGTLGPALASPAMLEGTSPRVISFVNQTHLTRNARHWYRVNYGVAPLPGGHEAGTYTIMADGQPIATLRDPQGPTPGGVYLPRRWQWEGNEFVVLARWRPPYKGARPNPKVGARAANFLDLGMEEVANRLGPEYEDMLVGYYATEVGKKRLQAAGITIVTDVRLEPGGWTVRST